MKKLFAQVLISLLALGCIACTACTTEKSPPPPPPKPALPYKINLVWQHDHRPEVDLSTLDKVPGINVVSPCWYEIENEYGKIKDKSIEGYVERAHAKGYQVWPLITNGFKPDRTKKLLDDENAKKFVIEQLRQIVVTALQGNQVPLQSLRDIVDLMRKNETSFPHFRNSNTYKLFEPPVFENKKQNNGYWF